MFSILIMEVRPMRAAIYCRVSTDEQRKHGISLEAQESRCRQYAAVLGLEIVHVGVEGASGKDEDRPKFKEIQELVSRKNVQHLLTVKLDRLNRETEGAIRLGKQCAKKGVKLHLVSEGGEVDLTDPAQEMLFTMRAAMATFERKKIALNTRFALARKRELGGRVSRHAPYGFQFDDAGNVIENADEQRVIQRIQRLHSQGYSERKIITKLASEGLFNRAGREFTRGTVRQFLKAA